MKNTKQKTINEKPFESLDMFYWEIDEEFNFIESLTEAQIWYFVKMLKSYKFNLVNASIKDSTEKGLVYRNWWLTVVDNLLKMCYVKLKKDVELEKSKLQNNTMINYKETVEWLDKLKELFWYKK